jgi:luciferase family oxidoreductase group 1
MKLSVLDQSPIKSGVSPAESIRESLALASECERFGYHRYWLSEHHNTESVAGSAPEILISAIAATTSRIRVGAAGIMLPHYSALKVAEQFRVLEAIAPGRIDLGLGRAPGSDGRTAFALNPNAAKAADMFPSQVRDVMAWTSGGALPAEHPFRNITCQPEGPTAPEIWILGSSNFGAQLAGYFGLPYCFAHFFTDGAGTEEALETYRRSFNPSPVLERPHCAIVVAALAADTVEEAEYWYRSRAVLWAVRNRGKFIALPSPEEAEAFELTELERTQMASARERALIGAAPDVAAKLRQLVARLQLDELVITTGTTSPAARIKSYELFAHEFSLHGENLNRNS